MSKALTTLFSKEWEERNKKYRKELEAYKTKCKTKNKGDK